jgi:hypothetical protein
MRIRTWVLASSSAVLLLGGGIAYWLLSNDAGDPRLQPFVHAKPPVAIVFTSRSEPQSLHAAAPEGEGFTEPGQRPWAAREGRLRLLTPRGTVRELTWEKRLPDGDTLVDVMSPSISIDGERILFAGRRASGHGRFRLYEIGVDGSGLRQLTGGPDDEGCAALPPLRWRSDGSVIPHSERRTTDYDDVDPIELNFTDRRIAFVSSRMPDLGRDHARRSTTLWLLEPDGRKRQITANRNNDRWPFLLSSGYLAFSLWSRNREVVADDMSDIRPASAGATAPTDAWLGAFTQIPGGHFGMLAKPSVPVWRPRPLFANRIAFMTTLSADARMPLTVVQAPPGLLANAPSAIGTGDRLPRSKGTTLRRGPDRDAEGRPLWLATPSPCPPSSLLMSGAAIVEGESVPRPGAYGLYMCNENWPEQIEPASAADIDLKLLFDDPDFVDAEPVAIYERNIALNDPKTPGGQATPPAESKLANGRVYEGPMGQLLATAIDSPTLMRNLPGQRTDSNQEPIFDAPPAGKIDHIRIYAANRDRFDDPKEPRIAGNWELILRVPVQKGVASSWVPAGVPTVLAGFDSKGHVVRWTTTATDSTNKQASFYAYAGDHYSLAQPNGKHFCVGCHPGHSGMSSESHNHGERLRR